MEGPLYDYVPGFVDGTATFANIVEALAGFPKPATRLSEPFPAAIESLRRQVEQRCRHPMTECIAECELTTKPTLPRWIVEADGLAPRSALAIVSAGDARTLYFVSYRDYRISAEQLLEPGSLLVITERHLRRWRPEFPVNANVGANARLYFRYRLSSP